MNPIMAPSVNLPLPSMDLAAIARRAPAERAQAVQQAALGFEGMFVSQLIKQMREALEPGTMFGSDTGDVLGGLFDMTMGQHLAKSGALGIAKLLQGQWTAQSGRNLRAAGATTGQVQSI